MACRVLDVCRVVRRGTCGPRDGGAFLSWGAALAALSPLLIVDSFVCGWLAGGRSSRRPLRVYLWDLLILLAAAIIHSLLSWAIQYSLVATFRVSAGVTALRISPDDRGLVSRLPLHLRRFDAIAFELQGRPDDEQVARVVGFPGETVAIENGFIMVNGQLVERPPDLYRIFADTYSRHMGQLPIPLDKGPMRLRQGEFYVLGDVGFFASDSLEGLDYVGHQVGALPLDKIRGRVVLIDWPPRHWRAFP